MDILIIGSKGFIGQHCVRYFVKENNVWQCDVVQDYTMERYVCVIDSEKAFHDLFSKQKFDICINCSGAANVGYSIQNPLFDFQLNTLNVVRILDAIKQYNPECRFINLSSAAVYGNPTCIPTDESQPYQPISPYGYHKVYAEQVCREFTEFSNLKTCCVRIFSAYGPGLKKQLFWDISQKIAANGEIELYGTGNETRDFIYIDDLVYAIACVIQHSDFNCDFVNIANGCQIKISTVADIMKQAINPDIKITFNNKTKSGDPLNWEANIERLKSYGYQQHTSIEEGVRKYVLWLKNNEYVK